MSTDNWIDNFVVPANSDNLKIPEGLYTAKINDIVLKVDSNGKKDNSDGTWLMSNMAYEDVKKLGWQKGRPKDPNKKCYMMFKIEFKVKSNDEFNDKLVSSFLMPSHEKDYPRAKAIQTIIEITKSCFDNTQFEKIKNESQSPSDLIKYFVVNHMQYLDKKLMIDIKHQEDSEYVSIDTILPLASDKKQSGFKEPEYDFESQEIPF